MNILFLDAYFEPESTAYTHIEHDLIEALISRGNEIYVVCPIPTRGIDKTTGAIYENRKQEELYNGHVHVTRFWAPQEGKNPVIRAFRYLWCNFRTFVIGKRLKNIDIVFANSTPPTQGWIAGKVKKKLGIPFVFNLQDIFPDSLANTGLTQKGSLLWKIGRKLEDRTYRNTDKIITISNGFSQNIIEKGVPEDKIVVVPNWVDSKDVYPIARKDNKLFDKYSLDRTKFYISYSGNIGHTQNMSLLLDVARDIHVSLPDVRFILIGDGAAKADVEKRVKDESINNVIMLPYQPYEDIAHVFSLGDVGLIISKAGIGSNSVPSKTWSYMAAGKPILASFDEDSELCKLIRDIDCGITIEADNKEKMVGAIKTLVNSVKLQEQGENGKCYLVNELDKDKCVGEYIKTLGNVVR